MGFCEVLTLIFIVLKLCEVINWSWWLVVLPEIIAIGFYVIVFLLYCLFVIGARADKIIKENKEQNEN